MRKAPHSKTATAVAPLMNGTKNPAVATQRLKLPRNKIAIIRIDPKRQTVMRIMWRPSPEGLKTLLKCRAPGHEVLMDLATGDRLCVAANSQAERTEHRWRIKGMTDDTAGIGVLFGMVRDPQDRSRFLNGVWDAPCDLDWVHRMIEWMEPLEPAEVPAA